MQTTYFVFGTVDQLVSHSYKISLSTQTGLASLGLIFILIRVSHSVLVLWLKFVRSM